MVSEINTGTAQDSDTVQYLVQFLGLAAAEAILKLPGVHIRLPGLVYDLSDL